MFDAISRLFAQPQTQDFRNDPKLAVAALLVHLSAVDGIVTDNERTAVKGALTHPGAKAEKVSYADS